MWVKIIIAAISFVAGFWYCILMTSSHVDSMIEEIRKDYRKALAEQIKKIERRSE